MRFFVVLLFAFFDRVRIVQIESEGDAVQFDIGGFVQKNNRRRFRASFQQRRQRRRRRRMRRETGREGIMGSIRRRKRDRWRRFFFVRCRNKRFRIRKTRTVRRGNRLSSTFVIDGRRRRKTRRTELNRFLTTFFGDTTTMNNSDKGFRDRFTVRRIQRSRLIIDRRERTFAILDEEKERKGRFFVRLKKRIR